MDSGLSSPFSSSTRILRKNSSHSGRSPPESWTMGESSLPQASGPDDVSAGEDLPHMALVADRVYLFPQPAVSKGSAFWASESLTTSLSRWSPRSWGLGRSSPRPCRSPNLRSSSGCTLYVVNWGDWTQISALFYGFLRTHLGCRCAIPTPSRSWELIVAVSQTTSPVLSCLLQFHPGHILPIQHIQ